MLFNFQVYFFTVRPKDVQKRPLLSCFEPSELYNLALSKDNMANWTCNWKFRFNRSPAQFNLWCYVV